MYPNLFYAFRDLFGVDWKFLRFINSFGFFVAMSFIISAMVLGKEVQRKESEGLIQAKDEVIVVGKPASFSELLLNFILGFILGFKIIGIFLTDSSSFNTPQDFIFSSAGSWPIGLLLGGLFCVMKWWEKHKQKLSQPEERKIRVWPHDRIGDIVIIAAVAGFAGAKVFNSLETWSDFIRNPIESLFSFSGLTFYGGLICAAFSIIYYAKSKKISVRPLADCFATTLMLAYSLGRIGCQVSGDGDWGIINSAYYSTPNAKVALAAPGQFERILQQNKEVYQAQFGSLDQVQHLSVKAPGFLPDWLFAYAYPHNVINEGVKLANCQEQYCSFLPLPVFPTAFYETIGCLLLFFVLWFFRKRFNVAGTLFAFYLILNGIERFSIEQIRVNTKYKSLPLQPTQAEIISILLIITGVLLWVFLKKREKNRTLSPLKGAPPIG
jgi:phosphatidylglycerol:prolipoprotein diacylglycerol transferase